MSVDEPSQSDALRSVRARRRRPRHTLRRVVLWITGILLLLVLLSAGAGVATVALFLKDPSRFVGCDLDSERPRARGEKSFVYARDASRLGAMWPGARSVTIGGGTNEVMRNQIGERILGLSKLARVVELFR